jgi:Asp-tRNA(Asn)/Glu-tRNA(Gln) amidotransferase A subunit family amidase
VVARELLELAGPGLRAHLGALISRFEAGGAVVEELPLPASLEAVVTAGMTVLRAEAAAQHESMFAAHGDEYAPQIAGLVTAGLALRAGDLEGAQRARTEFRAAVAPWLARFDGLLSPVAPGPAPRRGEGTGDPTLCAPWSYAGVPAISIPTGLDDEGLPLAAQLVGGASDLGRLLVTAAWCERVAGFDAAPP